MDFSSGLSIGLSFCSFLFFSYRYAGHCTLATCSLIYMSKENGRSDDFFYQLERVHLERKQLNHVISVGAISFLIYKPKMKLIDYCIDMDSLNDEKKITSTCYISLEHLYF